MLIMFAVALAPAPSFDAFPDAIDVEAIETPAAPGFTYADPDPIRFPLTFATLLYIESFDAWHASDADANSTEAWAFVETRDHRIDVAVDTCDALQASDPDPIGVSVGAFTYEATPLTLDDCDWYRARRGDTTYPA